MGEKDATERTLESYGEIFADIMNVLMFNGEQIVRYDGAGYRTQLLDDTNENGEGTERHRYPVLTLVLYFGKTHWTKNRSSIWMQC